MFRFKKSCLLVRVGRVHPVSSRLVGIAWLLLLLALAPARLWADPAAPSNPKGYRDIGWDCYLQGDYTNAITNFTKAIRQNPRDASAYNCRALAKEEIDDLPGALADYRMAANLNPNWALVYVNCGELLEHRTNKLSIAIADYTEAIRLEPANANTYIIRARAFEEQTNYDKALNDYNSAIQLESTNATFLSWRGDFFNQMTNYDAAIRDYNEAIRLDPTNTWYLGKRSNLYEHMTNYDAAISDLTQCIQLQPTNAHGYMGRAYLKEKYGWALTKLGNQTKANEILEQLLNDYRQAAELDSVNLSTLGYIEYKHGLYDDAIADYTKHLKTPPDHFEASMSRAMRAYAYERVANNDTKRADLKKKNAVLEQALADWNQLCSSETNLEEDSEWLCERADFYARNNQFTNALADYQKAVELEPTNSHPLISLASFLATCPDPSFRNGTQAMVFAHKACDPDHSKYQLGLTGLAAAYAETGDFEQAVNLQNKALQLLEAMQQKLGTFGFGAL